MSKFILLVITKSLCTDDFIICPIRISSIKSKMSLLDKFQKFFFKLVKANVGYEKKNNASVKC